MGFIGRRLAVTVLTLFLVSLITFAAFTIIPGDSATLMLGIDATDEQIAALRTELGLDRGLAEQYGTWLGRFLTGNLGNSARFRGEPIAGLVRTRLPVTGTLAVMALLLILVIAFPVALLSARREGSPADRLVNTAVTVSISIPNFFLGVLLIWIFGLALRLFTPGAYISYTESVPRFVAYLFFPALALALPNAAMVVKFLRASIFAQLRADYVRTAYSRGARRQTVLYRHVLKNAVIPAITLLGMISGELFSGSIVIEQVFAIPGIGRLLLTSITSRDYTAAQALVVYIAVIVVAANTLVDIIIQIIDPRIRLGGEKAA